MEKASLAKRLVALVVDGIAMWFLAVLVAFLISYFSGLFSGSQSALLSALSRLLYAVTFIVLVLFQFFYFGFFWGRDGRSIGMMLAGVKVVRRDGGPVSFLRGGLRGSLGYWISGLAFGLGFIWAAFDANREAWHDKLFDTWVVPAQPSGPEGVNWPGPSPTP